MRPTRLMSSIGNCRNKISDEIGHVDFSDVQKSWIAGKEVIGFIGNACERRSKTNE